MKYKCLSKEPQNILVMRLGGIGEIIAITPALRAIRKRSPRARITLLAQYSSYEIIKEAGLVDEIISADEVFAAGGLPSMMNYQFISDLIKLIKQIGTVRYDLFLSFQHLYYLRSILKPMLIGILCGARRRVGFNSYNRGFFLTDRVPDFRMEPRHLIYRNKEFLQPLGIDVDDFSATIAISKENMASADVILQDFGITKTDILIGVNPGSSRPATRWDKDGFCALLCRISQKYKVKILLVGSKDERELCDAIANTVGEGCINIAGSTTISQLTAIIAKLKLFISNDTGPLHIAHTLEIPTIGIFRPGEYPIWGSYNEKDRFIAIYRDIWCAPCYRYTCGHHTCMKLVEVDEVYRAVEQLLHKEDG